jgi:hypothetical protein
MKEPMEIRLEALIGRQLLGGNNQPLGRIEEFRAQVTARGCVVREVVIGVHGLLERLDLGARLVVGARTNHARIARWDQIDFSNPLKPRLVVDVDLLDKA